MTAMLMTIPSLASLCTHAEGSCAGPSVDAPVDRLRRYVYLKKHMIFLMAERFPNLGQAVHGAPPSAGGGY
jgi:hypothetical protein